MIMLGVVHPQKGSTALAYAIRSDDVSNPTIFAMVVAIAATLEFRTAQDRLHYATNPRANSRAANLHTAAPPAHLRGETVILKLRVTKISNNYTRFYCEEGST
jgi:hypothetical protein